MSTAFKTYYIYSDYGYGDRSFIATAKTEKEVTDIIKKHKPSLDQDYEWTFWDDDPPNMTISLEPL